MLPNSRIAGAVSTAAWLAAVTALTTPPPPASTYRMDLHAASCAVPNPGPTHTSSAQSEGIRLRPGGPARPLLLDLAGRLGADRCDATPGRFAVVRHHLWTYDTSGARHSDVVRWYAADDSGAELAIRSPRSQQAKNWWEPEELRTRNLHRAYTSSEWLISQAQLHGWGDDPAALVEGIATLAMWYSPDRQQRQLALQVLADATGLTEYPATTDRAGRAGIGIAAFTDQGRSRHLLILDSDTGQILAYEASTLTVTGWRAQVYLLLLTRTHSPRRWWEPPTASAVAPPRRLHPHHSPVWLIHQDQPCITRAPDAGATR